MADEPRRSGRATKGQHKNASSSPAPAPPKPAAKAATSSNKKGKKATSQPVSEDEEDEEDQIRCICGNDNPKDKRAFIGCDACSVWQHNICMGMPDDEDEVGEHYFCERCRPEEHAETLEAIAKGEKIWETRNKIWLQEKKMSKNRKAKGKRGGWLKKEVTVEAPPEPLAESPKETTTNKRKRESEVPLPEPPVEAQVVEPVAEKPARVANQGKRRKSSAPEKKAAPDPDPETAIVSIEELPIERKKIAQALSTLLEAGIKEMAAKGWPLPEGETLQSIGASLASKIEYALQMNHVGPANKEYATQFRMLNANLRQNKSLLDELLSGAVTADQLATMSSSEMASDKLQQERAAMKAEADRQATIDQRESGPRYRRTHKGDELVEDENATTREAPVSRPVRHSIAEAEMGGMGSGSPTGENAVGGSPGQQMPAPDTTKRPSLGGPHERRTSSQQNFDVNNIWAKTAQSPTQTTRPLQMPPRRRSSVQQQPVPGAKEDADVDRMLADDDDTYAPADAGDAIVWRGKIVQSSGDSEPTVNARFVAGRDVSSTIPWRDLLPLKLCIDGRLQVPKAEEYLCGLQWSSSSDVSVLAMTPYDDAAAFNGVFEYFLSRQRYAVVNKDKPPMVKDLYIIPVEVGGKLPEHVEMLEHCEIGLPVEERVLLATFVVARPPAADTPASEAPVPQQPFSQPTQSTNGHHLPPHLHQGPQGSPIQATGPHFSPAPAAYPASPIPPNPYGHSSSTPVQPTPPPFAQPPPPYLPQTFTPRQQPQAFTPQQTFPSQQAQQQEPLVDHPLAQQILGPYFSCFTAQGVLRADMGITEDKLGNLERILREDEAARTDMQALGRRLGAGGG